MLGDRLVRALWRPLPGIGVCVAISVVAVGLQQMQSWLLGHAYFDAVVVSIVLGVMVRFFWEPPKVFHKGIKFSGKTVLEIAIVLLGAGLSFTTIMAVGPKLMGGIVGVVGLALAGGYGICRMLGLSRHMAVLVACGNAICGNSAIAATAPVVGASDEDVATSIAFTAVLGVGVVIVLPLLVPLLGLTPAAYGMMAGMTVYAVSQVLAATAPVALVSVQVGTLVKLVRVLLLGPVLIGLSLIFRKDREGGARVRFHHVLPWFIVGFMGMVMARTEGWIGADLLAEMNVTAGLLTVVAMAALGLGVDVRRVAQAGPRVMGAAVLCVILLAGLSGGMVWFLGGVKGF